MPGSRHDKLVRLAKVALPAAVGVLVAVLAVAPLDNDGDVSFILDKNKVDNAPERMRVDVARYTGEDNQGRPFQIVARSAVQPSSDDPIVDISRDDGAARACATGRSRSSPTLPATTSTRNQAAVSGPVRVTGPNEYRLTTSNVMVDLKDRTRHRQPAACRAIWSLATSSAGRLRADLGQRTVTLDRGVRLKIVQGAVR